MNSFAVYCVVLVIACAGAQPPPPPQNQNIDKECLTPPSENVDPMTCCQLPDMLDDKTVDDCEKKVYGSTQAADDQKNDSPFAPHIRVN